MKRIILSIIFWIFLAFTLISLAVIVIDPRFNIYVTRIQIQNILESRLPLSNKSVIYEFTIERGVKLFFQADGRIELQAPFAIRPAVFQEIRYEGRLSAAARLVFRDNSLFFEDLSDVNFEGSVIGSERMKVLEEIAKRAAKKIEFSRSEVDALFQPDRIRLIMKDLILQSFTSMPIYTLKDRWWHQLAGLMIVEIQMTDASMIVILQVKRLVMEVISLILLVSIVILVLFASFQLRLSFNNTFCVLMFYWMK